MSRPKLGEFILNIDYWNCEDDTERNQLIDVENQASRDVTMGEIKEGFAAFEKKVCVSPFGTRHSPPYWAAHSTALVLTRLLSSLVDDDDKLATEGAEIILHAWEALVRAGPNSTHLDLIQILTEAKPDMLKHVQTLPGERVRKIVATMKIDVKYQENEAWSYGSFLKERLKQMYKTLTPDQCWAARMEFLDVYAHYQRQLPTLPAELAQQLNDIISYMPENFPDKNPYLRLNGGDVLRAHLSVVRDLLCSGDTVTSDSCITDSAERTLRLIINAVMANESPTLFEEMFDTLTHMLTEIFQNESLRKQASVVYDVYRTLLMKMEEMSKVPTDAIFKTSVTMAMKLLSTDFQMYGTMSLIHQVQKQIVYKIQKASGDQVRLIMRLVNAYLLSGQAMLIDDAERAINEYYYTDKNIFVWKVNCV